MLRSHPRKLIYTFSKHSIDGAAERAGMRVSRWRAADPTLKKASRHAIADSDAGYPGADFDHLPSAVRERHEVRLRRHPIRAQSNCQVAKIERTRRNLDQHLSRAWLWRGKIYSNESGDAGGLWQLVGTHVASRSPRFVLPEAILGPTAKGRDGLDAKVWELTLLTTLCACVSDSHGHTRRTISVRSLPWRPPSRCRGGSTTAVTRGIGTIGGIGPDSHGPYDPYAFARADQRVGRRTPSSSCLLACQNEATGARAYGCPRPTSATRRKPTTDQGRDVPNSEVRVTGS
jgi:hypothetical protein